MSIILEDETRLVLNTLQRFGALTMSQIRKIFEGTNFNPDPMIAYMCKARMIQYISDQYIVLQNRPSFNLETLYCVWVMIDKIRDSNSDMEKTLMTANRCDNGCEACFISNSSTVEYVTYISSKSLSRVALLQSTFYTDTGVERGKETDAHRLYTFVVKEDKVMDEIAQLNLPFPWMIAYIEGDVTDIPVIEYYAAAEEDE